MRPYFWMDCVIVSGFVTMFVIVAVLGWISWAHITSGDDGVVSMNPLVTPVDVSNCGLTKSCYRSPANCVDNCDYVVTWELSGTDRIMFELQGSVTADQHYIALGLSYDALMGDDSVTDCIHDGADKPFVIQRSYNIPHEENNEVLADPMSSLVADSLVGYYGDGHVTCRFTEYINVTPDGGDVNKLFKLDDTYHLLIAKGPVNQGKKGYHGAYKIASSDTVSLTFEKFVNIGGTTQTSFPLIKVHGILMILAWMVCASFAIIMPRYYKKAWQGKTCNGKDIWFQIHQTLMLSTMFLTLAGFVAIFIHVGGYADYQELPSKAHPPLGIATTLLVVINPIMAAFRPAPTDPKRPIFRFFHFCVGVSAHILSVATIYIGVSMPKAAMPDWSVKIMGAYVVWHVLIEIILAIHKHCCTKTAEDTSIYAMKQLGDDDPMKAEPVQDSLLQTILAVVHLLGIVALALALIIPLALS